MRPIKLILLNETERTCGVTVVNLQTGQVVALLRFDTVVREMFVVTMLPGMRYPDLINDDGEEEFLKNSFTVPDASLADVTPEVRS